MNILLDTNILIPLEDTSKILSEDLSTMMKLCSEQKHNLFVHPLQVEDLQRDKDEKRKCILLSRIKQYQSIDNPPILSEEELKKLNWRQSNDNDRIDNNLLFSLYRNAVHLLITNDEEIHKKAKKANLQDRVYRISQFLLLLNKESKTYPITPVGIENGYLYNFDISQDFFDSLRNSYDGFNDWYKKAAEAQRKCWYISENNHLIAICIYKEENDVQITDKGKIIPGRILKLCTFKVDPRYRGRKIGERILYIAFKYCKDNHYKWIYLSAMGNEQKSLIGLCEEYGFSLVGKYNGDDVYLKPMTPDEEDTLSALEYNKKYYPYYIDTDSIQKFIIPIQPQYHNDLFADISDTAAGLFKSDYTMYSPQCNTIKKAYLCHSSCKQIKSGDIILFYRSGDRQSIECIGIVEQAIISNDIEIVLPLISKRTVFSNSELEKILSKDTLVILFRYIALDKKINIEQLTTAGIRGNIQTIRKISQIQYKELFK